MTLIDRVTHATWWQQLGGLVSLTGFTAVGKLGLDAMHHQRTLKREEAEAEKAEAETEAARAATQASIASQFGALMHDLRVANDRLVTDVDRLREEAHKLRNRLARAEAWGHFWIRHVEVLEAEIVRLGGTPPPRPEAPADPRAEPLRLEQA